MARSENARARPLSAKETHAHSYQSKLYPGEVVRSRLGSDALASALVPCLPVAVRASDLPSRISELGAVAAAPHARSP